MDFPVISYGDRALLVEFESARLVPLFRNAVLAQGHPALRSVVPATRTVLVEYDTVIADENAMRDFLASIVPAAVGSAESSDKLLELDIRYDGADLDSVAEAAAMSVQAVIDCHADAEYTVQFCGFSPGFGYLTGLDPRLQLPRLASPRPVVPAGSVAIAGEFTGVYPRSSPGGWLLLGHTAAVLFDLRRSPPVLLVPGTRVRFVPQ
jgi:KipI family sensor histidine kinase inhibitor